MATGPNMVMALSDAVSQFVVNECHVSIGGFTINRNPMAAVYEIIRQGIKGLHVYAHSNGQGIDELVGAGCVAKLEIAYAGSGRFAPTCIRFRKAVENGSLAVEDYSNYQMTLRFLAGAMGIPFMPTRSGLGSSIVDIWGFDSPRRTSDSRLPDKKIVIMDNPFGDWADASRLVLVPAINPDVTMIHVQQADPHGNCHIHGLTFADVEQAKAAKRVIVTCEELVTSDRIRSQSDQNQIPSFCVDAVVPIPFGAYPTACFHHYDYDPIHLNTYKQAAQDDDRYLAYLQKYVIGLDNHDALLKLVGTEQLSKIKADRRTGYAVGLDRR
ncbi:MAG: CoA transferase subunit A [Deltaproteobacteria bacterium]|nr:CoA transferase subunit A [Deltaproteobacteria bacterium]